MSFAFFFCSGLTTFNRFLLLSQEDFLRVTECPCDTGGQCCQVQIQLQVTNESRTESLRVYTDDLVSNNSLVRPVHRTFSLKRVSRSPEGLYVETLERHTFSDGDLVSILELAGAPKWMRALQCTDDSLVLVPLFSDIPIPECENAFSEDVGTSVGKISNRQLLYVLGPNQTISFTAIARKGSGREWSKWSPTTRCFHRPLFRDNVIKSDVSITHQQALSLAKSCPMGVFDVEDTVVSFARPDDCNACRQCVDWEQEHNLQGLVQLSRRRKPEWQRITVVSNGSLQSKAIYRQALEIIQLRLLDVSESAGQQLMYPQLRRLI